MRTYVRSEIPRDFDPRLVKILQDQSGYLEQVEKGMAAIGRGAAPTGGGGGGSVTSVAVADHHKLSNLTTYDDHTQYLLLAGRKGGQVAYGAVPTLGSVAGTFTNGGNFTSKNSKTPTATWSSIAIDTSAAVGDIIVLFLATPTFSSLSFNGGSNNHRTITDTKGNTWTKLKEHQYSDGAALNGPCHSIWVCTVTTALVAATDTLTISYASSIGAMAISSHRFTSTGGSTVNIAGITSLGEAGFVGSEPSALSLSSLGSSVQYLFIRGSSEGNVGSNVVGPLSGSSNYTAFDNTNSFTSGGTGNVGTFGEYRILSGISDTTDPSLGASGGYFVSIYLALAIYPAVTGGLTLAANTFPNAAKVDAQSSKLYLYGHDIYFRDVATSTDLSYIRASADGAFVGPVVPSVFDVPDSVLRITGSSDATKKVAFEVDGLTTATTRTLTVPDVTATLLLSQGTSAGQVIGTGAHTGGTASSLAIEGPVLLGDALSSVNFTTGRMLDIRGAITNGATFVNIQPTITGLSGAASGTLTGIQVPLSGTPGYTSGSFSARGFFFTASLGIPSGVTLADMYGALFQTALGAAAGTLGTLEGLKINAIGASTNAGGTTLSEFGGLDIGMGNRLSPATLAYGVRVGLNSTVLSAVAQAVGFEIHSDFFADSDVVNWSGIRIPAISGPTGTILGLDIGAINNVIAGKLRLGGTSGPTNPLSITGAADISGIFDFASAPRLANGVWLTALNSVAGTVNLIRYSTGNTTEISGGNNITLTAGGAGAMVLRSSASTPVKTLDLTGMTGELVLRAGTTGAPPIRFISGTNISTPIAGSVEFTTDDLFFTITTGTARKAFVLDDGTRLTSGRIPAATTNGRLIDSAQATTGITAATFAANTSGIVDDSATWDGYTIGQVVAALRAVALLA